DCSSNVGSVGIVTNEHRTVGETLLDVAQPAELAIACVVGVPEQRPDLTPVQQRRLQDLECVAFDNRGSGRSKALQVGVETLAAGPLEAVDRHAILVLVAP